MKLMILDGSVFVAKGCLPSDLADLECAKMNESNNTQCNICEGNLCNSPIGKASATISKFSLSFLFLIRFLL